MNIICDGRRLNVRQAQALMSVVEPDMMSSMAAQGFRLCPMRAPRTVKGLLVVRFAWQKKVAGIKVVMRGTVTFQRPASP